MRDDGGNYPLIHSEPQARTTSSIALPVHALAKVNVQIRSAMSVEGVIKKMFGLTKTTKDYWLSMAQQFSWDLK